MKAAFLKGIKLDAKAIRVPLFNDLERVEDRIQAVLRSDLAYIQNLSDIVCEPRGKRLRPALLILASGRPGRADDNILLAATVVELIHTATLLHDDVVDGGRSRRGLPTLNARVGDGAALLMGDYVYSRAITLLVEAGLTKVLSLLAWTVHRMSIGELMQLELKESGRMDVDAYYRIIAGKTARLIESVCRSGAILGDASAEEVDSFGEFGMSLGMAFQIVDDILDYVASPDVLGKPVGADLAEGKLTLPLLKTLEEASDSTRDKMQQLLKLGEHDELVEMVCEQGGIKAAMDEARRFGLQAREALGRLGESPTLSALDATVGYVLERNF